MNPTKTYENLRHNAAVQAKTAEAPAEATAAPGEEPIKVDGFNQVLEMLRAADPEFRESLIRRLAQRDPKLVRSLREQI